MSEIRRLDKSGMEKERARLKRLRDRMLISPSACLERLRAMTEIYKKTEGQPMPIRRGLALKETLSRLTVCIQEDEFIVGRPTGKRRGSPLMPEIRDDWYMNEIDTISTRPIDRFEPLTADERAAVDELIPYWAGKSVNSRANGEMPEELAAAYAVVVGGGVSGNNHYFAHQSIDYTVILKKGAKRLIAELDERISKTRLSDVNEYSRRVHWTASRLALEGMLVFAERYAFEAERLAAEEQDPERRAELQKIAENCRKVPAEPAETFEQAVQCIWFTFITLMNEAWGNATGFMRADQYLYPYYKADKDRGALTDARAYELLGMLMVKANEAVILYSQQAAANMAGFCIGSNFILGGCGSDGKTSVNDLSYLFLEAEEDIGLNSEEIVIRVSDDMPDSFLLRAFEVSKGLCGKFKWIGDNISIRQMLVDGRTLEQARNYVIIGCTSPSVPGESFDFLHCSLVVPMVLELVFNDGKNPVTGMQAGPHTGDPRDFTSFQELWDAFVIQTKAAMEVTRMRGNFELKAHAALVPNPFQSVLSPICTERGEDILSGGTRPNVTLACSTGGIVNAADALAACKKLIFDEKKLTMAQMLDACKADFNGCEKVLRMIEKCPKFGNGDPYVDSICNDIISVLDETPPTHEYAFGGKPTVCGSIVTGNVPCGAIMGAQPDGRRAGTPLAEGGLSPHQGRNVSGVTATMRSVAGLDHLKLRHGSVLNLRFDPDAVKDESKMKKLTQMMRAYFAIGGFLVQFNFVSTETLRDAQAHPENYRDLVVRVATYSAYFVELSKAMQADIIARLENKTL